MPKTRVKLIFKFSAIFVILQLFLFYLIWEVQYSKSIRRPGDHHSLNLSHVIVHLDLKGAPPKLSYLNKLLPMLKEHGATGLLMEYEDMFPYEGTLANLSAKNCYRRYELRRFLYSAKSMGLELIPLIQTFGHMESVLKLREYQHLREQTDYPDSICPSRVESRTLITNMLDQVLKFHKSVHRLKFVHIGCDEVYHINICAACRRRMLNNEKIFLQHIIETSAVIKRYHPDVTVLIWDDMLRGIPPLTLNQYTLRNVEPVVWNYRPNVDITHRNMFKYYNNFDNIWISSAFKGANNKATTIPDINKRFANHISWMKSIREYKMSGRSEIFNFRGIFLTGWSRFSHFDPLCEVLPVSIPSLLLCLMTVQEFVINTNIEAELIHGGGNLEGKILNKMYLTLNCTRKGKVSTHNIASKCMFDEVNIYKSIIEMTDAMNSVIENEKAIHFVNGGLLNFYIDNQHANPNEILNIQRTFENFEAKLNAITRNLTNYMTPYFDNYVIEEYIKYKMYVKDIVKNILNKVHVVKKFKTWERGPVVLKYLNNSSTRIN